MDDGNSSPYVFVLYAVSFSHQHFFPKAAATTSIVKDRHDLRESDNKQMPCGKKNIKRDDTPQQLSKWNFAWQMRIWIGVGHEQNSCGKNNFWNLTTATRDVIVVSTILLDRSN